MEYYTTTNKLFETPAVELVIEEKNANNAEKDPDCEPVMESEEANKNNELKRKKRQMMHTEDWENNRAKIEREMGQDYNGGKKIDGKRKYNVQKEKRKMKELQSFFDG